MLVWTAVTRWRQALGAAVVAALLAIAGWSVIGFAGFSDYPRLISSLTYGFGPKGYSLMAFGTRAGLAPSGARFVPLLPAVLLCALCIFFARRGRPDDAFIAAIGAALLGSPILWLHYTVILLVALAVKRPSFGLVWAGPILFWLAPTENPSSGFEFALGFCLVVLLLILALRPTRPTVRRSDPLPAPIVNHFAVERSAR
jgi:hypothetical protein